jgi:hypothetical protein
MRTARRNDGGQEFSVGSLFVCVLDIREALGQTTAREAASLIQPAICERGVTRVIFSAANSQLDMVESPTSFPGIDSPK